MKAHAYLKSCVIGARPGRLPFGQLPLHAQGRIHCTLRMILLRHRRAKDDQDAISSYGPHYAPIPLGCMVCQLMQRMQPALPGLQAPLFPLHSGSHQSTTQNGDDFPLATR
jgi:hypothetical protein